MLTIPCIVRRLLVVFFVLQINASAHAEEHILHLFERQSLTNTYFSEGISGGDINGDGHQDVVYGPYWFAGPRFEEKFEIYPPIPQPMKKYADHFFSWVYDFDGDAKNDVLTVGFPGTAAYVYKNPGHQNLVQHWEKIQVLDWVSNESPQWTNLIGDAKPELICTRDSFFGFATVDWEKPLSAWQFHPISEKIAPDRFGHGLGVGDINGDGRLDILRAGGWFEQPAEDAESQRWREHKAKFTNEGGGAEMYAYDVDGDGDNDVITSLSAHEFGLAWYEQIRDGDEIQFKEHLIMGKHPSENRYGVLFSELHSVNLADIDGDGLKDIVTGKTYYSHHEQSPMWDAGAVVYWFKLVRSENGVDWIPYQVDDTSGIGRQVIVHDFNLDGLLDIASGGMLGAHVLMHQKKPVDLATWTAAQPKRYEGPPAPFVVAPSTAKATPKANEVKAAVVEKVVGAMEAEGMIFKVTGGTTKTQAMGGFTSSRWSNNQQLWWTGAKPESKLSFEIQTPVDLVAIELVLTCARNYGVVRLSLDDQVLAEKIDLFRDKVVTTGVLSYPVQNISAGKHVLVLEIIGANPKALPSYMVGIDYVRLRTKNDKLPVAVALPLVELIPDQYPHKGLDAKSAAAAMKVPEGFKVEVCASEPDVQQPIAFALDDRGRTWVAEAYEYPTRAEGEHGRDRILIFEDQDGDGKFDSRKVFAEGFNLVSGLEVGFGGVWVGAAPYLMFIADRNHDDVPDGEPVVLLDGWGYQDTHETLNAFTWGPDGWLYGCHGVFTHSRIGKPGMPDHQRIPMNAGVWRYHPVLNEFEVFAHGTSNPWGVDFNEVGDAFITACVIPHLFHMIQGGRYHRQGGQHFNPHTYNDIKTIAEHLHYLGATPHSGNGKSDEVGGGHAHAGAMIYQGAAWPKEYHHALFMNNIHGQRLNVDRLQAKGSGYVGKYSPDFLLTGDMASQILNLRYGPDGQVTMIDWYDMQACHSKEIDKHDRSNGRIYKITYGDVKPVNVDLAYFTDLELAELCLRENDWYVRHARRLLQERASLQTTISPDAIIRLKDIAHTHADAPRRLRAIWALHGMRLLDQSLLLKMASDSSPNVRSWAIRLAFESPLHSLDRTNSLDRKSLWERLSHDDSPVVRLALASALQRIPVADRWPWIEKLLLHSADASDHNLPLMYWYAVEPMAEIDADRALAWAMNAGEKIPMLRNFMLRRIAGSGGTGPLNRMVSAIEKTESIEVQETFLNAIQTALAGQRSTTKPEAWDVVYQRMMRTDNPKIKLQATSIAILFGDQKAISELRQIVNSIEQPVDRRLQALHALLAAKDPTLVATLLAIVTSSSDSTSDTSMLLREAALRGLAQYDDPTIAAALLRMYPSLSTGDRRIAIATLCSRANSAISLLQAIERKQIQPADLSADLARQIEYFGSAQAKELLVRAWGQVRASSEDKAKLIENYKKLVNDPNQPKVDVNFGRAVFMKTCQRCHVLYGLGQHLGPDLTGSNRANLDYLIENIVDPSSVMANEYRQSIVMTDGGQVITGIIRDETEKALSIQTADAIVIVPKDEIEQRKTSEKSMMPDDQLSPFSPHEIRSLVAYLQTKEQVPLLATSENISQWSHGHDLTGWKGNLDLWSIQNGEIVGKTSGLRTNAFLVSDLVATDFKLTVEILLVGNEGNSGVQFRSVVRDGESVEGYQADVGKGWWGKLYEEHGRKLLWDKSGEQHVKEGDWNRYTIEARGSKIQTWLNDQLCVDLDDPFGRQRGVFAFQLHSGGPTEVRFRNLKVELQ